MQEPQIGETSAWTDGQAGARRRARRLTAGLGLTVLVAAAAYVSVLPLGGPTASRAPAADFSAIGTASNGLRIGQSAPEFVSAGDHEPLLLDLDGNRVRVHDFAGMPVWIVFWTTWCIPCQQEASDIRASYQAHHGDGLAVLAIDIQEPAAAVREFALSHDLEYAIGLDRTGAVKALYGAWGLPSHFFLDGSGVIMDRYFGQMTRELMEEHLRVITGS
jgi:peroxiredoxin